MPPIAHIESISQVHRMLGHQPPKHPYISFLKFSDMNFLSQITLDKVNVNLYCISLKSAKGKLRYGRGYYDYEEGTLLFSSPNQLLAADHISDDFNTEEGWTLLFHPDLLIGTDLGKKIQTYNFFSYEIDESLHVSETEHKKIEDCIENIIEEYCQNLDGHSQDLIVSNLDLLLNYCNRFYNRQFLTRIKQNKGTVAQIERLLKSYFNSDKPSELGLPTVKYCAEQVNLSPNYLSDLLKKETGKNTKEHIDYYLIEKAKSLLMNPDLNINEIAFELGFEYPKSFSKLFKKKVGQTPSEYRL